MQRITKLKINAFMEQFAYAYPRKWGEIQSKANFAGRSFSEASFSMMEEFVAEELDRELSEIISAEKEALWSIPSIHEDDYFQTLTNKLLDAFGAAVDSVVSYLKHATPRHEALSPSLFDKVKRMFNSKIARDIQIMREELRMEKSKPASGSLNINVDVGLVNFVTVQGSVHISINKVSNSDGREIAEILGKFLKAIESSSLSEPEKIEHMQQIDLIANQAIETAEKRNSWAIKTSLAELSVTDCLTSLWTSFGPTLHRWFGL